MLFYYLGGWGRVFRDGIFLFYILIAKNGIYIWFYDNSRNLKLNGKRVLDIEIGKLVLFLASVVRNC